MIPIRNYVRLDAELYRRLAARENQPEHQGRGAAYRREPGEPPLAG